MLDRLADLWHRSQEHLKGVLHALETAFEVGRRALYGPARSCSGTVPKKFVFNPALVAIIMQL